MTVDYTQMDHRGQQQPSPGTWWSRNGKWVLLAGCLAPLLLAGTCVASIAWFVFGAIRESTLYTESLRRAQSDPAVIEALGAPVEAGWWVSGNVNLEEERGSADFRVPLKGSRKTGTLEVTASREGSSWNYSVMRVHVDDGPIIDLIPSPDPSPTESDGTDSPAG